MRFAILILTISVAIGLVSCKPKVEHGARSLDAMMLVYFEALSTRDVDMFSQLLPDVELSWGVYNEADRADKKAYIKTVEDKNKSLEEAFRRHAEEFGGVKVSVTGLDSEPEQALNVVWSAEPYGKLPNTTVIVSRDGKLYRYKFSNIMQYRGRYYLEESPFVDIKHWE